MFKSILTIVGLIIFVLFILATGFAIATAPAAETESNIQLPSGDLICKEQPSGFFKCEDSIVVCYRVVGYSMQCIKKN